MPFRSARSTLAAMRNYRRYTSGTGPTFGSPRQRGKARRPLVAFLLFVAIVGLVYAYIRSGKRVSNVNESSTNVNTVSTQVARPAALTTAACPDELPGVTTTEKIVALTFDVGTLPGDLTKTVPAVKAANVPATFFVTGKLVETDRAAVEAIHTAGFPIYNHTYDNLRFSKLTPKEVQAQLQATDDLIRGVTNATTKPYARIPFGDSTPEALTAMREAGYCGLTWTVDGLDIESTATVTSVVQRVQRYVRPGAIVLLHAGSDLAATATPQMVAALQEAGYRFVSLDDLFRAQAQSTNTNTSAGNQNVNAAA